MSDKPTAEVKDILEGACKILDEPSKWNSIATWGDWKKGMDAKCVCLSGALFASFHALTGLTEEDFSKEVEEGIARNNSAFDTLGVYDGLGEAHKVLAEACGRTVSDAGDGISAVYGFNDSPLREFSAIRRALLKALERVS